MKSVLTAFVLFASVPLASAPLASAMEVKVSFSEDFTEKLSEDYGEREGEFLTNTITKDLDKAFTKAGLEAALIDVTIQDAKPNRPTFEQLSDRPGLSYIGSISLGGMDLEGTAYDADGNTLATIQYDWFENDLRQVVGAGTWSDARRASRRFAKRLSQSVPAESSPPAESESTESGT